MARPARLLVGLAFVGAALLSAVSPASAGKFNPITYNPNPVPAGTSTTASGTCPSQVASFVTISFTLELSGGGTQNITVDIDVDPQTATFSGAIGIPANAIVQTVQTTGDCMATDPDGDFTVGFLSGALSISVPPTTTQATTTTTTTTTTIAAVPPVAPATSTTTTLGPVTLPATGSGSDSGVTAIIAAGVLALGFGLIVLARRRSAQV